MPRQHLPGRSARLALGLLLTLALGACVPLAAGGPSRATPAAPAPRTLHFMAGYKPQANLPFVGVYVAHANGYFAEEGLTVEVTHATGQGEHLKLLLQGTVDVTTAAADSVLGRRADDIPVVAFALLGQRGDRAYAVRADSPIRSPRDWVGRTVGYKVRPTPDYLALLAASGLDRAQVHEVPVGFDPRLLAAGRVDVYPVFESNEPPLLERLGTPVRLFRPTDHGVPALGLTYITRDSLLEQDPDLLRRFLAAALRGVAFARQHPDAATAIVMRHATNEDAAHQRAMLGVELEMADGPVVRAHGLGWATREQWQALHDSLLAFGGLRQPVDVGAVFSERVLRDLDRDGRGSPAWP